MSVGSGLQACNLCHLQAKQGTAVVVTIAKSNTSVHQVHNLNSVFLLTISAILATIIVVIICHLIV